MGSHFRLQVVSVRCFFEQHMEWGKDELRLIGFGISRLGRIFSTGYRELGAFGSGEVHESGVFPMTLFEADLPDNGLQVLIYLWLVEEDSGGVRAAEAALDGALRESYRAHAARFREQNFPRDCIPFTAFFRAVHTFQEELDEAASEGLNNDDVFAPYDLILEPNGFGTPIGPGPVGAGPVGGPTSVREIVMGRSKKGGRYHVTMRYTYRRTPTVLEP